MSILKNLVPDDLSYWLLPIVWMSIIIMVLDYLGYINPDYVKLNLLYVLNYVACVVSQTIRAKE